MFNKIGNRKISFEQEALNSRKLFREYNDEHQMEFVSEVNGVAYINDAKSIRLSSTKFSLEGLSAPTILILGGRDKGTDYSSLARLIREKIVAIVYLGKEKDQILKNFMEEHILFAEANSLKEAVKIAYLYAQVGDAVVFSPASQGEEDETYKTRGEDFKDYVKKLQVTN